MNFSRHKFAFALFLFVGLCGTTALSAQQSSSSTAIRSSRNTGNSVPLTSALTLDIAHKKKMPSLPRGHLLIPFSLLQEFRNSLDAPGFCLTID